MVKTMALNLATLRLFRIGGFAVFDFAISFLAMWLIGNWFGGAPMGRRFLYATVPFSVVAHYMAGQMTPLTRMATEPGNWPLKLVLVALVVAALM
jgi:polyferredoxin